VVAVVGAHCLQCGEAAEFFRGPELRRASNPAAPAIKRQQCWWRTTRSRSSCSCCNSRRLRGRGHQCTASLLATRWLGPQASRCVCLLECVAVCLFFCFG
jgi:hypothetical protein